MFWVETKGQSNRSAEVDKSVFNVFRGVALISRNPEDDKCESDAAILTNRRPNYATFHENDWMDEPFTDVLIPLLEVWSQNGNGFEPLLPNDDYFNEKRFFSRLTKDSSSLEVSEILQFMGYAFFINAHETALDADAFQQWMRVIHNLVVNSTNIDRAERLPGGMRGILALLPDSDAILDHLEAIDTTESVGTFAKLQLEEESLKATLLNHHEGWNTLIDRAELHGYFRGQIGFLLKFSGTVDAANEHAVTDWDGAKHEELQAAFEGYLEKAEAMFDATGVADPDGDFIWQRALLSVADYMFPMTAYRRCLLVDAYTEVNSWKRLLRGYTRSEARGRRRLKSLWKKLMADQPIKEQLRELVATTDLGRWREALVCSAHAMAYCKKKIIRLESDNRIYLLATTQMNGAHAELFTYRLYCDTFKPLDESGDLNPLSLDYYYSKGSEEEPGIQFHWQYGDRSVQFDIEWAGDSFKLFVRLDELIDLDDVSDHLVEEAEFETNDGQLEKTVAEETLVDEIDSLRVALNSLTE